MNSGYCLHVLVTFGAALGTTVSLAAPAGRMWIDPAPVGGPFKAQVEQYNLENRQRFLYAVMPGVQVSYVSECLDGTVWATIETDNTGAVPDKVVQLDRHSGAVLSSFDVATNRIYGIVCQTDGNLLVTDDGPGPVRRYATDGTFLGNWGSGLTYVRAIQRVPGGGKVALANSTSGGAPSILEFDSDGNLLRTVVSGAPADPLDHFAFTIDNQEILVTHRGTKCIRRYKWNDGTPQGDLVCDAVRLGASAITVHPSDGSAYVYTHENGCLYGWDAAGSQLYVGEAIACYSAPFYASPPIIFTDPPIPSVSSWGLLGMTLLLCCAGSILIASK